MMKRGLVRFWTALPADPQRMSAAATVGTSDLEDGRVLSVLVDLMERLAGNTAARPHERLLANCGSVAAALLIADLNGDGPIGSVAVGGPEARLADFLIDVYTFPSVRELRWKIKRNGIDVDPRLPRAIDACLRQRRGPGEGPACAPAAAG